MTALLTALLNMLGAATASFLTLPVRLAMIRKREQDREMKELAELLPQRGATWVQPAVFHVLAYSDFETTPADAW